MVDLPPSSANYGNSENSTPDEPLGLKHPLQPAQPLGINRQFLVPLGARSLSVLDLSIFQPDVIQADFLENPFLDSPFFAPEVPVSSSFPIELPSYSNPIQRQQSPQASAGGSNERSLPPKPPTPGQLPQPQPASSSQSLEVTAFANQHSDPEAILNLQADQDQTTANLAAEAVELETSPEQIELLQRKQAESYPGGQIEPLEQPRSESIQVQPPQSHLVSEQDVSINRSTFAQITDSSTRVSETPISNQQNSDLQRHVESENNQHLSLPLGLVQVNEDQLDDATSAQSEVIQAQSIELQSDDGRSLDNGLSIDSQAQSIDESQVYRQADTISQPLSESQAEVRLSSNPQLQRQDQVKSSDLEFIQLQQNSETTPDSQILKNSLISEPTQPTASLSFVQRQADDSNIGSDSQATDYSIQSDSESEIIASIPSDYVEFQSNPLSNFQIQKATESDPVEVRSDAQNNIEPPSQSIANSVVFQVDQSNQIGISSHSNFETEMKSEQQNQTVIPSQSDSETQVKSELPNDTSPLPNFVTSIDAAASISMQAQSELQASSNSNLLVGPSSQLHSQSLVSEPSQINSQAQVHSVVPDHFTAQTGFPIQPTAETKKPDAPIESEAIALELTNISAINSIPPSLDLNAQAKSESAHLPSQLDVETKTHSDQSSESALIRSHQELQTSSDTNIQANLKQDQPISSQSDAWIQAQMNADANDIQPLSQSDTQAQINPANQGYEPTGQAPAGISSQGTGNEPKEIQTTQNISLSNPWVQSQIDSIEATQSPSQLEHQIQPKSNLNPHDIQFESQSNPQIQRQVDFFPETIQIAAESDLQLQASGGSDPPLNSPGSFSNQQGLTPNSDTLSHPFEAQTNLSEISQTQLNSESFISDTAVSASNPIEIQAQPDSNVVVNAKFQAHEPSVLAFRSTTQPELSTVIQARSETTLNAQTTQPASESNLSIYQSNDWVHQSNSWIKPQANLDIQKAQTPSGLDTQSQFQTNSADAIQAVSESENQNQAQSSSEVQDAQFSSPSNPLNQGYEPTGQAPAGIAPQGVGNEPKEIQRQLDPNIQQAQSGLDSNTQFHDSVSPVPVDHLPDQNSYISTESQAVTSPNVSPHPFESPVNLSENFSTQHNSEPSVADSSIAFNNNDQIEIQAQADSNAVARSEFPDNRSSVVIPQIPTESESHTPIQSPSESGLESGSESELRIQNPQTTSQSNTWIQTQGESVGFTPEPSQLNNQLQSQISFDGPSQVPSQSSHRIQAQVTPSVPTSAQLDARSDSQDFQDSSKLDSQIWPQTKSAEAIQATENQIQTQSYSDAQSMQSEIFISEAAIDATNQVEIQTQANSNAGVHPKFQSDEPPGLNSGTISDSESPSLIQTELEPGLSDNEVASGNHTVQKQAVNSSGLALSHLEVQPDSQARDNSDIQLETQLTNGLVDIPITAPETVQRSAMSHTVDARPASESIIAASHSSDFEPLASDRQAQITPEEQVSLESQQTSSQSQPTVEIPVSLESQQTNIQTRPSIPNSTVGALTTTEAFTLPASQILTETELGDQQGYTSTERVIDSSSPQEPHNKLGEIQVQLEPEPATPHDQIRRQEDESSQQVLSITPSPETGSEPIQAQAQPETRTVASPSFESDILSQPDSDEVTSTKAPIYIQAQLEPELQIDSDLPTDAIARSRTSTSSTESQHPSSQPQSLFNTAAIETHIIPQEPVHPEQQVAEPVAQAKIQPQLDGMSQVEPQLAIQLQPQSSSELEIDPEQSLGSDLIQRQQAIETNAASNQQISLQASVEQNQSATPQLDNQTIIQASGEQDQSATSQPGSQVYVSSQDPSDEVASQLKFPVGSSFEKLTSSSQVSLDVLPDTESQLNPTIHSQPQTKIDQVAIKNLTHSSNHNIQAQLDDPTISSSEFQANHQSLPDSDTVALSQSSTQVPSEQEPELTIDSNLPTNSSPLVPDDIQTQISSEAPIVLEPQPNIQLQPSIETAQASTSIPSNIQTQASSEASTVSGLHANIQLQPSIETAQASTSTQGDIQTQASSEASEPHANIQPPIRTQAVNSLVTPKEPAALELTFSNQTPANTANVEATSTVELPASSQIPTNLQTQLEPGTHIEPELTVEPITSEPASGYQTPAETAINVEKASLVEPSSISQMPASIQTQSEPGSPIQPELAVRSESEFGSGFVQPLSQSADQPFNKIQESLEQLESAESSIVQPQLESELDLSSNFNSELFISNSLQPEPKSLNSELGFKAQEESKFKPQLNTPTDNIIRAKESGNTDISLNPDRAVKAEFESQSVNQISPIIESPTGADLNDRDTDFTTQISVSHGEQQDAASVPPLQLNSDVHQPKSEFLTVDTSIHSDQTDDSDLEVANTRIQRSQESVPIDDVTHSQRADTSDSEVADTRIQRSPQSASIDKVTHSSELTSPQLNEVQLPQVWQDLTVLRPLIQPGATQQSAIVPSSNSYAKVQPTEQSSMVTSTKLQRSSDMTIDLNRSNANQQMPDQWSSLADLVAQKLPSASRSATLALPSLQQKPDERKTLASRPTQPLSESSHSAIQAQFIETSPVRVTRHQPPTPVIARQEDELEAEAPDSVDYLEAVAQAIYHRLRQRMRVEQERHGRDYLGRLPW